MTQPHPACTPLVRILLTSCASGTDAESLDCGLWLLRNCVEPLPEAVPLLERAAATPGSRPTGAQLRLWRGDPRVGAALMPVLLAADAATARDMGVGSESAGGGDPWFQVLPPPAERPRLVTLLLDGLAAGVDPKTEAGRRTLRLAFHVLAFPEGYAGLLTPATQARIDALLDGQDDGIRLIAFHLLGHLAGEPGIDAAYTAALPRLRDLLLPDAQQVGSLRLRGEVVAYRGDFDALARLLAASRLRLTLCRLPLEGPDRARVFAWRVWRSDLTPPVAAWLSRTAPAGAHPLADLSREPHLWGWPPWEEPAKPAVPTPPPPWPGDIGAALVHLRDVPAWSAGRAVVDAALKDPQESARLVNLLTAEGDARTAPFRLALRDHAGLHAFADAQTAAWAARAGAPDANGNGNGNGPKPLAHYLLAQLWGDVLGDGERAAAVAAELYAQGPQGITQPLAQLARWASAHPLLDALQAEWTADATRDPRRAFHSWCLGVLRGRALPFPHDGWRAYLRGSNSDDAFRVMQWNAERFLPHLDALRSPLPPGLECLDELAQTMAAIQAAGERAP